VKKTLIPAAFLAVPLALTGCSSPFVAALPGQDMQPAGASSSATATSTVAPRPSSSVTASGAAAAAPTAAVAEPKVVAKTVGFGRRWSTLFATAILSNGGTQAGDSTVTFSAYDGNGRLLAKASAPAVVVRIGETVASGTNLDVPSGASVARVTAAVQTAGRTSASSAQFEISAVDVAQQGRRVQGTVTTTAAVDAKVDAVCYGSGGTIVGGGEVSLGRLSAGGASAFVMDDVTVSSTPTRCEVFAASLP
jgi:hypothetical protein